MSLERVSESEVSYLFYDCSIIVSEDEEFLRTGSQPVLLIESKGHTLHAFINQELVQGIIIFLLFPRFFWSSMPLRFGPDCCLCSSILT